MVRLRLLRLLAVLAWLAVAAQAMGVPIHLAVEEHSHHGHGESHVHVGRIGYHAHHHGAAHHGDPRDAPFGDPDAPVLPPHSALDHLIDAAPPRVRGDEMPAVFAALLPVIGPPLPPISLLACAAPVTTDPPEKPPPRRPEQSRAPPHLVA